MVTARLPRGLKSIRIMDEVAGGCTFFYFNVECSQVTVIRRLSDSRLWGYLQKRIYIYFPLGIPGENS